MKAATDNPATGVRFEPSSELEKDFADFLSKHSKEISRDPIGWRAYAFRTFKEFQPHKPLGRIPHENVTRAMELKSEGKSWRQIYVLTATHNWPAQQRLREAVRMRDRRRRYKSEQSAAPFRSAD